MDYLSQYTGAEIEAALNSRIAFVDVTDCFTDNAEKVIDGVKWNEINDAINSSLTDGKLLVFKENNDVFPLYNMMGRVGVYTQITISDDNMDNSRSIHSSYLLSQGNKTVKYKYQDNSGYNGDGTWFKTNFQGYDQDNPLTGYLGWKKLILDLSPLMKADSDEGPVPEDFYDFIATEYSYETPPPLLFLGKNEKTGVTYAAGHIQVYYSSAVIVIPYDKIISGHLEYHRRSISRHELRFFIRYSSEREYRREDICIEIHLPYPSISSSSTSDDIASWILGSSLNPDSPTYYPYGVYNMAEDYLEEISIGISQGARIIIESYDSGPSITCYGEVIVNDDTHLTVSLRYIVLDGQGMNMRELTISRVKSTNMNDPGSFICVSKSGLVPVTLS